VAGCVNTGFSGSVLHLFSVFRSLVCGILKSLSLSSPPPPI
jgi:hypothetical protein